MRAWTEMTVEMAHYMVPHCHLGRVYGPRLVRLKLVVREASLRLVMVAATGHPVAKRLMGQALVGGLEEALQKFLVLRRPASIGGRKRIGAKTFFSCGCAQGRVPRGVVRVCDRGSVSRRAVEREG